MERLRLIPTPTAMDSRNSRNMTARRKEGAEWHGHEGMTLTDYVTLFPSSDCSRGLEGSHLDSSEPEAFGTSLFAR
jgi:hypothetical protein